MKCVRSVPQSTGRLGSSSIQLNKSMTRLSSSQGMHINRSVTVLTPPSRHLSGHLGHGSVPGHHLSGSQVGGSQIGVSRLVSSPPPSVGIHLTAVSPLPGNTSNVSHTRGGKLVKVNKNIENIRLTNSVWQLWISKYQCLGIYGLLPNFKFCNSNGQKEWIKFKSRGTTVHYLVTNG